MVTLLALGSGAEKVNVDCYLRYNGEEEGSGEAEVFLSMVRIPVQKLWVLVHFNLGQQVSWMNCETLAGPGKAEVGVKEMKSDNPNLCP